MTQQQMDRLDRLVEDYLGAVSWACGDLDPQRRDELFDELREHVTAARGALYQQTEAAVRTILDRLGDPSAIADEARLGEPASQRAAAAAPAAGPVRRVSSATLGMWLGFFLTIVIVVVAAGVLMNLLQDEPPPPPVQGP